MDEPKRKEVGLGEKILRGFVDLKLNSQFRQKRKITIG